MWSEFTTFLSCNVFEWRTHGCRRHPFSKFPDFSVIKIFVLHRVKISLRSWWPQMFLAAFNGIKSGVLIFFNFGRLFFKISIFPDQKEFFSLTFPWPVATVSKSVLCSIALKRFIQQYMEHQDNSRKLTQWNNSLQSVLFEIFSHWTDPDCKVTVLQ